MILILAFLWDTLHLDGLNVLAEAKFTFKLKSILIYIFIYAMVRNYLNLTLGENQINQYINYQHFHNTLRFFDDLLNFSFTTYEPMRDYYL